jgi:xanthine dehydrogenase YagS FAD-binding subunit
MNPFEYVQPQSAEQAAALVSDGKAVLKAGGIDLLDQMKEGTIAPARLVNLNVVRELHTLQAEAGGLRVGATVTLAELAGHDVARRDFTALAEAAGSAATPQIRTVATVGGNLCQRPRCWYFRSAEFDCLKKGGTVCYAQTGENRYHAIFGGGPSYIVHASTLATALSAWDARLRLALPGGKSREVAIADFFILPKVDETRENVLKPGEVITEILVPAQPGMRSAYRVVKERQVYDWPLGEVAVALKLRGQVVEQARVVLGAAAPIPWRAQGAEQALVGKTVSVETARRAGQAAVVGAKPLGDNAYKVPLFQALVERTVLAAAGLGA